MGIEYSSIVDAPRNEVFAWHTRPGAVHRLIPPWQPMSVESEADSLADGRAVLRLPGGLRWISDHQPDSYDPPARFVDALGRDGLTSLPPNLIRSWRHEHRFDVIDEFRTRVTDRVDTPVPERALTQTFRYRHRQLADDLASHRRAHAEGVCPRTVAVTGSHGIVGSALTAFLSAGGYRVVRLVRRPVTGLREKQLDLERYWDPMDPAPDLLEGVDAVIHLAGASIAGRFTEAHKAAIRDSRVAPTWRLAELAAETRNGPASFVCASAIGLYGYDRGDATLDEHSSRGAGFLAGVVADWESATQPAENGGIRVVQVRTGIVQTPRGGTLQLMRPLFAAGLGGKLGTGRQWLSWIDIDDLLDVYHRALTDPSLSGPVNAVAPQPVRNDEYTRVLASVLHRPALLSVPGFGPRILLGDEGAREIAEASQFVVPKALLDAGHRFRRPELEASLRHQLGHIVSGE